MCVLPSTGSELPTPHTHACTHRATHVLSSPGDPDSILLESAYLQLVIVLLALVGGASKPIHDLIAAALQPNHRPGWGEGRGFIKKDGTYIRVQRSGHRGATLVHRTAGFKHKIQLMQLQSLHKAKVTGNGSPYVVMGA